MALRPGDSVALIIALQINDAVSAMKYDFKDDNRGGQIFGPSLMRLDGNDFTVSVRLIAKDDGMVRFDGKERYILNSELDKLLLRKLMIDH